MSTKSKGKSPKKAATPKPVEPFVPEPLPPITPKPTGKNPTDIPFPEWSDQAINLEKWDLPRPKDKGKPKPSPVTKNTISSTTATTLDEPTQFVDPHLVHLPNSLPVHKWKRPSEVFPNAKFIMYKESSEYPDLISGSKHLLHSDFMRSFISAIGILEYLGNTRPSPIEFASPTFFPNTGNNPWRPWFHIYSMCKAGKGQKHKPQVNTLGKYMIRLFWLGCWRNIVIDDTLPVNETDHVLLPNLNSPGGPKPPVPNVSKSTIATNSTKKSKSPPKSPKSSPAIPKVEIEIWPFLLSKSLLKMASLTWTEENELLDFDIIHCLTGWFVQKIDVKGLDVLDIWDICAGYTDHYAWPESSPKRPASVGSKKSGKNGSKASKVSSMVPNFLDKEEKKPIPHYVVAVCADLRDKLDNEVPDMSPCWSHHFLIDQTRVIPLIKPEPLPELERWKRFRWLAWAIRNGLWPVPEEAPIKCFKMISVFKKCSEHIVYGSPSAEALNLQKSVAVIEDLALEMGDGKKKGGKGQEKGKGDTKSKSSSSKGSKGSVSSKSTVNLPADPSVWGDFNKLGSYISYIYIFFKSSVFNTSVHITNIAQNMQAETKDVTKGKADKGKKGKSQEVQAKLLMCNGDMQLSRNEPVYIFLDNLDYKLLVINVAQMGNVSILEKDDTAESIPLYVPGYEAKRSLQYYDISLEMAEVTQGLERPKPLVPYSYVILENFNWQTSKVGDMTTFINTYGSKSMLVDVKPGRFILRLWIKSDTCFFINLMSDTLIIAGTLEDVLEHMTHEPERLQKICHDISSTYGQLVQSFGTPQFSEALIAFSHSYLPECKLLKQQISEIRDAFIKEFVNIIKQNCPSQEIQQRVFALKVLFMNPYIRIEQTGKGRTDYVNIDLDDSDDVVLIKKRERAAVTLQAFFKKIYVRKLRVLHNQSHKEYFKVFDSLKKNYTENLSVSNRMITGLALIRNFLLVNPEMRELKDHYLILNDLNLTIFLQHVTGSNNNVPSLSWVPITNQIFYCNSPDPVLVKICLFCHFPTYMVRVFNNDTNQEIKRLTNNTEVHPYENNAFGYTVLCYGWSVNEGNYPWKLDFVTVKQKQNSLIILPEIKMYKHTLKQTYIPNVNNVICRCLVSINHDVLATFRLSVSLEKSKLYFRCLNEQGQVISEIYGTENVILPAVTLKYVLEDTVSSCTSSRQSIRFKERKLLRGSRSRSGSVLRHSTNTPQKKRERNSDRFSLDRYTSKSSSSLRKYRSSTATRELLTSKINVFLLEGFIIDNSWPLTKNEWDVVDGVKNENLLGPPQSDKDSNKELIFMKPLEMKRQSKIKTHLELEKPFWSMETISNAPDNIVPILDKTREKEIKEIKIKWYEDDPKRYERGKQLRQQYLESHYIRFEKPPSATVEFTTKEESIVSDYIDVPTEAQTATDDVVIFTKPLTQLLEVEEESANDQEEQKAIVALLPTSTEEIQLRTLKKPVSETRMLPPLNLEDYYLDKDIVNQKSDVILDNQQILKEEKSLRTTEEAKTLEISRIRYISQFEMDQIDFEEDMEKYLNHQTETHKLLELFYKRCRNKSEEMMNEAYQLRQKVIARIKEEVAAKNPPLVTSSKKSSKQSGKKK